MADDDEGLGAGALRIDGESAVAPFEQVRAQLTALIRDGRLPVGARLPTVRALADELGLAVNTVARAYRELEGAGLVETRGRAGTVVRGADAALETARRAAVEYAAVVRATGVGTDDAIALLRTALGRYGG